MDGVLCLLFSDRRWLKASDIVVFTRQNRLVSTAELVKRPSVSSVMNKYLVFVSSVKPCPRCRRKVRLSQKTATVAVFCDSLTFLRQCGQGLRSKEIIIKKTILGFNAFVKISLHLAT